MLAEIDMAHDTSKRSQLNHSSLGVRDADRPTIRQRPRKQDHYGGHQKSSKASFHSRGGNHFSGIPCQSGTRSYFLFGIRVP